MILDCKKLEDQALFLGFPCHLVYAAGQLIHSFAAQAPELLFWFLLMEGCYRDQGHIRMDLATERMSSIISRWDVPGGQEVELPAELKTNLEEKYQDLILSLPRLFKESDSPFLIHQDCLYTRRQYLREAEFINLLDSFLKQETPWMDMLSEDSFSGLDLALPELNETGPLKELLLRLGKSTLSILSGGPGTGKTTALVKLVQSLRSLSEWKGIALPQISLTAPTGRAAKRMEEALVKGGIQGLEAQTLHRLLGIGKQKGRGKKALLPADLVVVDEASMLDLSMMTQLLQSLAPGTALLLIGDRDQLPSVESGALLGDLLEGAQKEGHRLFGLVTFLKKVYRSDKNIHEFTEKILNNSLNTEQLLKGTPGVKLRELPQEYSGKMEILKRWGEGFENSLKNSAFGLKGYSCPREEWLQVRQDVEAHLENLNRKIILSPGRRGFWGVEYLNRSIAEIVGGAELFHGMPLMILRNDYALELFNGDRGVVLFFDRRPFAVFPGMDDPRILPLPLLKHWERSYVMTVHKSQGSEFQEVIMLLPEESGSLLYRELLYTGITRARTAVELLVHKQSLEDCLGRVIERSSGISDYLKGSQE